MKPASRTDTAFEVIAQPESLVAFCAAIRGQPWLTIDTEFIRERTYYPRLCLLQIGVPGKIACIDPLAIKDLGPLLDILYDRSVLKVLHASSQDLEIFAHLYGRVPGPLFDTQMAAPLLGCPEQMGYGNFVKERLGVSLDKAHSRTDWSKRPLSQDQLVYAADDVRYLVELYPALIDELTGLGRLEWLQEEFAQLESMDKYTASPDSAWLRIRGFEKLRPKALSTLQLLASWRESTAVEKDLPRAWVLKDDVLVDIARLAPKSKSDFERIRSMPAKSIERYAPVLLDLVQQGLKREPEAIPEWRSKAAKPTQQEELLADVMQAQLRLLAQQQGINSALIASRKDLLALARGSKSIPVVHGWRLKMAGKELLAMLNGERLISVQDKQVHISDTRG